MIRSLELHDFMSHADTRIDFIGSTIAVTGDNGSGKSSLLEAIPYAYYGFGRGTKESLSRLRGDGSHEVILTDHTGVRITRGRKASGVSWVEVRSPEGALIAKGKEADDWIMASLKASADLFMLTAFYGMGDSYTDPLLRVVPSARLEFLQDLAQVGVYRSFLGSAKTMSGAVESKLEVETARLDTLSETLLDDVDVTAVLKNLNDTVSRCDVHMDRLKADRAKLQVKEEVYHSLIKERERLSATLEGHTRQSRDIQRRIDSLQTEERSEVKALETYKKDVGVLEADLVKLQAAPELEQALAELKDRLVTARTMLSLHETAVTIPKDSVAVCPLCSQPVTDVIVDRWSSAVDTFRDEIQGLEKTSRNKKDDLAIYRKAVTSLEECKELVDDTSDSLRTLRKQILEANQEAKKVTALVRDSERKIALLDTRIGDDYARLQGKVQGVLQLMDTTQQERSKALGEITQIEASRKKNAEVLQKVLKSRKDIADMKQKVEALGILKAAWSRYGIPLRLVSDVNAALEERATAIYREFDNGSVAVREEDDRGKPGIQFYLCDRKGDRTYSQLSMGEKIMFFVAIRVAAAQLVADKHGTTLDFLVLDEAMGNLSDSRRTDLVRLLNRALRRIFPQVILVTHTSVPEVFDQVVPVRMENGVSKVGKP
jgi:exonuclease SbcC